LIETCKDGEEGFRTAAESLSDPDLRTLFQMYSKQRAQFAGDLQNEVIRRGGEPPSGGHVSASVHRGWMNLKSAITGKDEAAVIAECERGEDAAVKNYEDAMKGGLPSDLRTIVETQYYEVKDVHDRVRSMERVHKAT